MSSELESYAVTEKNSRGREHAVRLAKDRSAFQRDYTRILHSSACRRLQGKTQVFPAEMGGLHDSYRTRMSHSFEVEQISRSFARQLKINQDLCAALSIGHDIGHAPFGHMGQDVLNEVFKSIGGFEHNHQALRIVDHLESPYPEHPGLNLMFETREGLLKHCSTRRAKELGAVAARHLNGLQPTLEMQAVDLADQIAYLHGDLEDALDKGVILPSMLMDEVPGFKQFWADVKNDAPAVRFPTDAEYLSPSTRRVAKAAIGEVWRRMLSEAIEDGVRQARVRIEKDGISSLDDVRSYGGPIVTLSEEKTIDHRELRQFSRKFIYNNPVITAHRAVEEAALREICLAAIASPEDFGLPPASNKQKVLDWVASLTDRSVMMWSMERNLIPAGNIARRAVSP